MAKAHQQQFSIQSRRLLPWYLRLLWVEPTSTTPAHEAEVCEFGYTSLHDGDAVAQLRAIILIVTSLYDDFRTVLDFCESTNLPEK